MSQPVYFCQSLLNFSIPMRAIVLFLLFVSVSVSAQPLRDINFNFLYDPTEPIALHIKNVRTNDGWHILFNLAMQDTSHRADQFLIRWDTRTALADKEGEALDPDAVSQSVGDLNTVGEIKLPHYESPRILTARVMNNFLKRVWVYYVILEPNFPMNGYLTVAGQVLQQPFLNSAQPSAAIVQSGEHAVVSYYRDDFPAAVPPFSEGMASVARGMEVDSTFTILTNQEISFAEKGLYLVQKDTSEALGFSFRVEEDYPRFAKVESLGDPLIYVCTKQEFDRIKAAGGEKKAFDKVILSITGNADRAKNFIRNYFRRVEWANYYFTSYKEGWKTDRGMIYILFGLPDQLLKFSDREVWIFESKSQKATFTFIKSSTVFDPENYVLIRENKFKGLWYEKIDLWRNARF